MTHVLVGDTRSRRKVERLKYLGWGRMLSERWTTPFAGEKWGFDNGAYRNFTLGLPFDEARFLERLAEAVAFGHIPYMAIVPDIVAAGCSSLDFSLRWIDRLRAGPSIEWPWYLAVQDGQTIWDIEPYLDKFDGIFLGGTDTFKRKAWTWCRFAHDHRLKFHYGRAGTLPKMKSAVKMGADSLDSAFPLWTEERFSTFWQQYDGVDLQHDFPYMERA